MVHGFQFATVITRGQAERHHATSVVMFPPLSQRAGSDGQVLALGAKAVQALQDQVSVVLHGIHPPVKVYKTMDFNSDFDSD